MDIYIPSKNIAIEYNGLYWHSEKLGKHKDYHLDKTKLANSLGVRLIHIFEDEWKGNKDVVKNRLRHILGCVKGMIYARKCTISEINTDLKDNFLLFHFDLNMKFLSVN